MTLSSPSKPSSNGTDRSSQERRTVSGGTTSAPEPWRRHGPPDRDSHPRRRTTSTICMSKARSSGLGVPHTSSNGGEASSWRTVRSHDGTLRREPGRRGPPTARMAWCSVNLSPSPHAVVRSSSPCLPTTAVYRSSMAHHGPVSHNGAWIPTIRMRSHVTIRRSCMLATRRSRAPASHGMTYPLPHGARPWTPRRTASGQTARRWTHWNGIMDDS